MPAELVGRGTLFALRVRGDSMTGAGITSGDVIVVRQQAAPLSPSYYLLTSAPLSALRIPRPR